MDQVVAVMNTAVHSITGFTPEAMDGDQPVEGAGTLSDENEAGIKI